MLLVLNLLSVYFIIFGSTGVFTSPSGPDLLFWRFSGVSSTWSPKTTLQRDRRQTERVWWRRRCRRCLHGDRGSRYGWWCRCRRRGYGVSGWGQIEQCADGSGHLGEPSLLQDVQRKTQLTLQRQTPQKKTQGWKKGKKKTTEKGGSTDG